MHVFTKQANSELNNVFLSAFRVFNMQDPYPVLTLASPVQVAEWLNALLSKVETYTEQPAASTAPLPPPVSAPAPLPPVPLPPPGAESMDTEGGDRSRKRTIPGGEAVIPGAETADQDTAGGSKRPRRGQAAAASPAGIETPPLPSVVVKAEAPTAQQSVLGALPPPGISAGAPPQGGGPLPAGAGMPMPPLLVVGGLVEAVPVEGSFRGSWYEATLLAVEGDRAEIKFSAFTEAETEW